MSKRGKGVILYGTDEPDITGYLIIGTKHYEICGVRVSPIRTHLEVREAGDTTTQEDLFDGSGEAGAR